MIVLKYQESTTEQIFENAQENLFCWGGVGGATKIQKKRCLVGPELRIFGIFESPIDINNIFPG